MLVFNNDRYFIFSGRYYRIVFKRINVECSIAPNIQMGSKLFYIAFGRTYFFERKIYGLRTFYALYGY